MGARRAFRPLLLATVSLLAAGPATPAAAMGFHLGSTGLPICTAATIAANNVQSGVITGGQVFMWGLDQTGNLGRGVLPNGLEPTPEPVFFPTGSSPLSNIYISPFTTYAIDTSGVTWGWGDNFYSELGQAGPLRIPSPVQIPLTNVRQIADGVTDTLAVTADGTLWGWGKSIQGELNVISNTVQVTPQVIPGISGVAKVAVGDQYTVILKSDGTVVGGGADDVGQLGLGTTSPSLFTQIPGLSGIVDISVGADGGDKFLVALDSSGNVFFTGLSFHGEMGSGTAGSMTPQLTVVPIPGLSNIKAIATGGGHVLALQADGTVLAWGANQFGQLGNGTVGGDVVTPALVHLPAGTQVVAIAAGLWHSMALDNQGGVWTWGDNRFEQVGSGVTGGAVSVPFKVNIGAVPAPQCAPAPPPPPPPQGYVPSHDGYAFDNASPFPAIPGYNQLRDYYPASAGDIYLSNGSPTRAGLTFYALFKSFYSDGLCYGMATSDTFLFNRTSDHSAGTFDHWTGFFSPLNGDTLSPPLASTEGTIGDVIDRYHSRLLAALGAASSVAVWNHYARDLSGPLDRTRGNLDAFDVIAANVKKAPEVVAFGPTPFLDPLTFGTLFNNSHAVVAYETEIEADGTRVIKVFDPSSVTFHGKLVTDQSEIRMQSDGSVTLVDFANGADPKTGGPRAWIGGGTDQKGRNMGQPGDWILMPLPDVAFSDNGSVLGLDNRHWVIPHAVAVAVNFFLVPFTPVGTPIFHFSGPAAAGLAVTLDPGAAYDEVLNATAAGASTSMTIDGHVVSVTQTDSNAAGSSHHLVIDPAATSIALNAVSQAETFNLEIAADFLPAYSRDISMAGVPLNVSQSLNVASDAQTSGLTIHFSGAASMTAPTTFEQDGANAGKTTVPVIVPANSLPATVSVFDWNSLATSLIFEVIDAQGTPTGVVLQGNPQELAAQISTDLASLQATIAGITDQGLRDSLAAKVAAAQDSFTRGQDKAAANTIDALRHEINAQDGKALSAATATQLRSVSAEALVLLEA